MNITDELKNFLDGEGKLKQLPKKRKMKLLALSYLAQKFDTETEYTEKQVNEILSKWHIFGDSATLRRELYDFNFIDRNLDGTNYKINKTVLDEE